MTVKEIARDVVEHASDDCSVDELVDNIILNHRLEICRQQSERGERIPYEEVVKQIPRWIENASK